MSDHDSSKPASLPPGSLSPQDRARIAREELIGKTVQGRYVLRSLLGHGGMGAVYEAEHLGIGKRVAIKFVDASFLDDEQIVTRFAREARAMSAIESPHIVSIFDAGTEDGRPYLVMELLRGEDLGQRLRRTTRVDLPEALHIIAMMLKGLAKAHDAGIVHRDLKPDNVFLVANDGDPVFVKIVDFGVSKIERPRNRTSPLALTGRGTVLGTPFYMSPEQAQAAPDLDGRADLFSVGAILFECLSGRPPHTGETYEQIILSICMTDAPELRKLAPDVPDGVAAFVARALSRDRAARFGDAESMLAALHELSPEERTRVPLDKTLPAGSSLPSKPPSSPNDPAPPPTLVSSTTDVPVTAPKRSLASVVVTSVVATALGLGITIAIVTALSGKPPDRPSARYAPPPSASFWTVLSNTPPIEADAAPPVAVVSAAKPPPRLPPPAPKPSAKGLDISRDLP